MAPRVYAALAGAFGVATLLAGCGGVDTKVAARIPGKKLTIYAGVPLEGASAVSGRAVVDGARLALAQTHGRIGSYRVVFSALNDATAAHGEWDPGQTSANAVKAASDPTTVGYIGDVDSGASAVSIPILNAAGIPQVSPRSSAVGLTASGPGASPGEPAKYYPTHLRTFVRVVPSDAIQAAAQVKLQLSQGCTKTYVLDDSEVDGEDLATSFGLAAQHSALQVVGTQEFEPHLATYLPLAQSIAASGANCVFISAISGSNAVPVTEQIARAVPRARIFVGAGVAQSNYVEPAQGGIPLADDTRVMVTSPALGARAYPSAARAFFAAFSRQYGPPQPDAILGYESMRLLLSAIRAAMHGGQRPARRSAVVQALFGTRDRHSVLGTYSIEHNGNTTLSAYGVWRVVGGRLRFWKAIDH